MRELTRAEVNKIPDHLMETISHFLIGFNASVDLSKPHVRPSIARIYPVFIFIYVVLVLLGTVLNFGVIFYIVKKRLYKDPTHCFMINLALCDIVKCLCVLPITLTVLLIHNWMFGELVCFFLPMLQDIPLHVSMLSYLLIAIDRYRLMRDPMRPRLPAFVCAMGTWLLALCIVLPYPIYITYLDLGMYLPQFTGVEICMGNLQDDMKEYMRGLFLVMYVAPLSTIAYLYVRVSRELQTQEGPLAVMMFEARSRDTPFRSRTDSHSTATTDFRSFNDGSHRYSDCSRNGSCSRPSRDITTAHFHHHRRCDTYEAELDVDKENRTQKYLISMVTVFGICMCPLMILKLARLALFETYENSANFDIIYIMLVWIGFLPTVTTPCLFASWQMSRPAKERLRGYFRFSNRKLRHSCEAVINSTASSQQSHGGLHNTDTTSTAHDHEMDVHKFDKFAHTSDGNTSTYNKNHLSQKPAIVHHGGSTKSSRSYSQRSTSSRSRSERGTPHHPHTSSIIATSNPNGNRSNRSVRSSFEGRQSIDSFGYQQQLSPS